MELERDGKQVGLVIGTLGLELWVYYIMRGRFQATGTDALTKHSNGTARRAR